jgi:subtilisin family serine protease
MLLLLSSTLAFAQGASKFDARARIAVSQLRSGGDPKQLRASGAAVNDAGQLDVFIRGDITREQLEALGVTVRTALPGLFTAYIPVGSVDLVAADARVSSIHGAVMAEQTLNASLPTTGAPSLRGAGPTFTGMNGANVLVGDVDTGIDIHHGDFKDNGGLSRILYLWDQTTGSSPPSGFTAGTEWTKAQIDGGTCTETDSDGHGSHCMGIAAGDGSQTGGTTPIYTYVGMAPMADIAMVKTTFYTTDILDGVNYIFQRATALGKNAVCNLSLGSEFGPHDGTSDFETGLDALSGPGRLISVAAGNDRGTNWHAGFSVPAGGDSVKFAVSSTTNLPLGTPTAAIDGYYNSPDNFTLTLRSPTGAIVGPITMGNINAAYPGTLLTGSANVYIENGATVTSSGAREVYIEVTRTASTHPVSGTWTLIFTPVTNTNSRVDMWKFYSGAGTTTFSSKNTNDYLVSEPGNAYNVVTVAAFATKASWTDCGGTNRQYASPPTIGAIASFSGLGPTRDGRQKPDITAPGFGVASARSFDVSLTCGGTTGNAPFLVNDGGNHIINQGTSMAAPHVTGAIALLFQKFGAMTPAQVKTYLFANATLDGNTGGVWNSSWGNGKLHLGDILSPSATVLAENGGEVAYVGTTVPLTWSASDNVGVTSVDLNLSRSGPGGPWESIASGVANSGSYNWLVTDPPTNTAYLQVVAHDAAGNTGSDLSDNAWTISYYATPTLLSQFVANSVGGGIELRWQLANPGAFSKVTIERAAQAVGPWSELAGSVTRDGDAFVLVDGDVSEGATYDYRLVGTSSSGSTTVLGSITATAGTAITRFAITRVAPNPSKDVVNVEFTVPRAAQVRVVVLDVQGREVATLANGMQVPGRHQALWSGEVRGAKATSGVYFVRMQAPGVTSTRRVSITH